METVLNKLELDVAKELLNIGLSKAADSMSFFTKQKVLLKGLNITFSQFNHKELFNKEGENFIITSSEIRGDVEGYTYLIYSENGGNTLAEISLPASIKNDPVQFNEMKRAILLEADNIITGSVTTQFSNMLGLNMYGLVPSDFIGNHKQVENHIFFRSKNGKYMIKCNAELVSDDSKINPEFLWFLDDAFIGAIKDFVAKNEKLQELVEIG